jgi:hypothetical protein
VGFGELALALVLVLVFACWHYGIKEKELASWDYFEPYLERISYNIILGFFQDTFKMGTFGYNCRLGKCDFVPTKDTTTPQVLFYGIGFTLPW